MYLCNIDFSGCSHSSDVEYTWSFKKPVVLSSIEQCVLMIKLGPNQQPRWFTPTLRDHITCVRTLRKRYLRSPTDNNKTRLHTAETNLNNEFIQAKSTYESTLIHNFASTNDSKIYQYIWNITNSHLIPSTVHLTVQVHRTISAKPLFSTIISTLYLLLVDLTFRMISIPLTPP